jgi:hypothetical protein
MTVLVTTCFCYPVYAADGETEKVSGWKKFTNGVENIWNGAKDAVVGFFLKDDETVIAPVVETKTESEFERGYRYAARLLGNTVAEINASEYIDSIQREINKLEDNINGFGTKYNYSNESSAGFIAEEWCAGTYNINAKANGADSYAVVPRSNQNGSADVVLSTGESASLKYYADANGSVKAQVHPKYGDQTRIIPADQIDDGLDYLNRMYDKAVSVGKTDIAENIDVARNNLNSNIKSSDGTQSTPLTKTEAERIAKDAKTGNFKASDYGVTTSSAAKIGLETVKCGATSMLIAVPLAVAPDIIDMVMDLAKNGEISKDD